MGLVEQTLRNWVKAFDVGTLNGAGAPKVTPEAMELSRPRAENARLNREVVGWSLKPRMTADLVTDALTMGWFRRKPPPGLIHHCDRGSQYASQAFR